MQGQRSGGPRLRDSHRDRLLPPVLVVVAQQVEHPVHEEDLHLPLQRVAPLRRLPPRRVDADDHVPQHRPPARHEELAPVVLLHERERENVRGLVHAPVVAVELVKRGGAGGASVRVREQNSRPGRAGRKRRAVGVQRREAHVLDVVVGAEGDGDLGAVRAGGGLGDGRRRRDLRGRRDGEADHFGGLLLRGARRTRNRGAT